jgi:hypothetical protein
MSLKFDPIIGLNLVENPVEAILPRGEIQAFNDARLNEGHFNEPLTTFAVAGWTRTDLKAELDFLAPEVPTGRRFTYKAWSNPEQFLSDTGEDLRAIGGDFKRVEYTSTKVAGTTQNRGLVIHLDEDEFDKDPNWEQRYTQMLIRRLQLNAIRRAYALLVASAVSTNRTWSTAGNSIDPDNDIRISLRTGQDISGLRNNRAVYGQTGWDYRFSCYRSDGNAARFGSSLMSKEQVANTLAVDQVLVSETRYQSAASTKSQALGSNVLSFYQTMSPSVEDPSHLKRFVSPTVSGGPVRVFKVQKNEKTWVLGVEMYDQIALTYASGIRLDVIG